MNKAHADFAYNVTVVLANDGNRDQTGKLFLALPGIEKTSGIPINYEVQLTPHSTPLKAGNAYSYYVNAPFQIEAITGVTLYWKQKSWQWSNALGINELHVNSVILEPGYLSGSARSALTKMFCAAQEPVAMEHLTHYQFDLPCY